MDAFDLSDDDLAALMEPERTDTWLAAFDAGLRRAGVSDEEVGLRHSVDRALLDDARVSPELRQRASTELLDDDTLDRFASEGGRTEELTLAWLATLMKWAAQYEVLAAVGRLEEAVFLKAAQYAMEAGGFVDAGEPVGSPGVR